MAKQQPTSKPTLFRKGISDAQKTPAPLITVRDIQWVDKTTGEIREGSFLVFPSSEVFLPSSFRSPVDLYEGAELIAYWEAVTDATGNPQRRLHLEGGPGYKPYDEL